MTRDGIRNEVWGQPARLCLKLAKSLDGTSVMRRRRADAFGRGAASGLLEPMQRVQAAVRREANVQSWSLS